MNNEMNLKDKYREETNKDVYSDDNVYGGSYSDQYVKWLEKQVKNNSAQQINKDQGEEMKPIKINSYSEHCPHCDSENITMIGDPEYNDEWECDDCKKLFSSFLIKGKK